MLQQNELTDILRRAQEIQEQAPTERALSTYQQYIEAAEEAGISREATIQALRERLGMPVDAPTAGQLVFALSADGHYYPARILSGDETKYRIQFMNGSEATRSITDLRELSFIPGQKLTYYSASSGIWWTGDVVRFNEAANSVTVASWGDEETVPLDKVRLPKTSGLQVAATSVYLRVVQFLVAGGIGFALAWWLR